VKLRAFALMFMLPFTPALADEGEEMGRRVQELLHAHQADVFACVQSSGRDPNGEILVRVFAGESAQPARVDLLKDQSGGGPLGGCVVDKIRNWDLSSLRAAPGDQLVFPLAFKPEGKALVDKVETPAAGDEEQAFYHLATGEVTWFPPRAKVALKARGPFLRVRWMGGPHAVPDKPFSAVNVKSWPIAGGKGAVQLLLDNTGASFAVDHLLVDKGASVPPHKHDGSDELIYVLDGKGTTTIGGKAIPVAAGDSLRIPAGVEHSLVVTEKLNAVQVYAPGGPEQRFKK
jgi:quercetin dioxygenase-like cupin family protein